MKHHPDDDLNDIKIISLKFIFFVSAIVFAIYSVIFLFKGGESRAYFPDFIASGMSWGRAVVISIVFSLLLAMSAWWCYKLFNDFRLAKHSYLTIIALVIMSLLTGACKAGMLLMLGIAFFILKLSENEELYNVNRRHIPKSFKRQMTELKESIHRLIFEIVEDEELEESPSDNEISKDDNSLVNNSIDEKSVDNDEPDEPNFVDKVIERVKDERDSDDVVIRDQTEYFEKSSSLTYIKNVGDKPSVQVAIDTDFSKDEEVIQDNSIDQEDTEMELSDNSPVVEDPIVHSKSEVIIPEHEKHQEQLRVTEDIENIVDSSIPKTTPEVTEHPIVGKVDPIKPKTLGQIQSEYENGELTHEEYELEKQAYLERQMNRARNKK